MNFRAVLILAGASLSIGACTQKERAALSFSTMSEDDHLKCAAQISAFDRLIVQGRTEPMPEGTGDRLVGMMSHLAAYAVPQDIREPDAFAAMNDLRDQLLASEDPADLRSAAQQCIDLATESLG